MNDLFNILTIARLQGEILVFMADGQDDIGIKIAALRASADMMQTAVNQSVINATILNVLKPQR